MKFVILLRHRSRVYVGADERVKRPIALAGLLLAAALIPAGCASPPASSRVNRHVVAVSYNVELVRMLTGPEAASAMDGDFERFSKLGFDTVVLRHAEDESRPALIGAVRGHGLQVAEDDPSLGASDSGGAAVRLCSAASRADGPQIDRILRIDCRRPVGQDVADAGVGWLRTYHEALCSGLTGGLLAEGFRAVPGLDLSYVEGSDSGGPRSATALRRVTARARAWGARLSGLTPTDIQPVNQVTDALRIVALTGQNRRYVLLVNRSADEYIRGTAELPEDVDSRPVQRAVSVPADSSSIAGPVIQTRGVRLHLQFDLGPGDAALWELF